MVYLRQGGRLGGPFSAVALLGQQSDQPFICLVGYIASFDPRSALHVSNRMATETDVRRPLEPFLVSNCG